MYKSKKLRQIFGLKFGVNLYADHKIFCQSTSYALFNTKLLSLVKSKQAVCYQECNLTPWELLSHTVTMKDIAEAVVH